MGNSRNDYHRNKYRDWDDEYTYREGIKQRSSHRREKKLTNALRARNVDALYDLDENE